MVNFGFSDLRFVKVHQPNLEEAVSAVGAQDVLKNAKQFSSLKDALSDCNFAFAATSLKKREVEKRIIKLPQINNFFDSPAGKGKTAVVFGSEKTGLSNADIALCDAVLNIPTAIEQPSINLAQAVNLVCYEISKINNFAKVSAGGPELASKKDIELAVKSAADYFEAVNFKPGLTRQAKEDLIRDILSRAALPKTALFTIKKLIENKTY